MPGWCQTLLSKWKNAGGCAWLGRPGAAAGRGGGGLGGRGGQRQNELVLNTNYTKSFLVRGKGRQGAGWAKAKTN